jgi:hypothetical protein
MLVPKWYRRAVAMNFRPDDALADQLREQAELEQISVQALLVKAAGEYLTRHSKKAAIDKQLNLVKTNFADALRRLGEGA